MRFQSRDPEISRTFFQKRSPSSAFARTVILAITALVLDSGCGQKPQAQIGSEARSYSGTPLPEGFDGAVSPSVAEIRKNPATARVVRVRLYPLLNVSSSDPYLSTSENGRLVVSNPSGLVLYEGTSSSPLRTLHSALTLDFTSRRALYDGQERALENLRFTPADGAIPTMVSGIKAKRANFKATYRGEFKVVSRIDARGLELVNSVPVEDYLRSVVQAEIGQSVPAAAIQAQAIAARGYTIWNMVSVRSHKSDQAYDVLPTTQFQVYLGASIETAAVDAAVVATRSQILSFDGRVVLAMYYNNSGGTLCSEAECMGTHGKYPYFVAKPDVPGVRNLPGGERAHAFLPAVVQATLDRLSFKKPSSKSSVIKTIAITDKTPSGKVAALKFEYSDGSALNLETTQAQAFSMALLKSKKIDTKSEKPTSRVITSFAFYTLGDGHGLGMSQSGAEIMARKGSTSSDILNFYYPGTSLTALGD